MVTNTILTVIQALEDKILKCNELTDDLDSMSTEIKQWKSQLSTGNSGLKTCEEYIRLKKLSKSMYEQKKDMIETKIAKEDIVDLILLLTSYYFYNVPIAALKIPNARFETYNIIISKIKELDSITYSTTVSEDEIVGYSDFTCTSGQVPTPIYKIKRYLTNRKYNQKAIELGFKSIIDVDVIIFRFTTNYGHINEKCTIDKVPKELLDLKTIKNAFFLLDNEI